LKSGSGFAPTIRLALILADFPSRRWIPDALLERRRVSADDVRVREQVSVGQRLLVAVQLRVHLPELSLLPRALAAFRGLERMRMQLLERVVAEHVADFPGVHVILDHLRLDVTRVAAAERAFEV
jgi:hypothetical protein